MKDIADELEVCKNPFVLFVVLECYLSALLKLGVLNFQKKINWIYSEWPSNLSTLPSEDVGNIRFLTRYSFL